MKIKKKMPVQTGVWLLLLITIYVSPISTNAQVPGPKGIPDGYTSIDGDMLLPTSFVRSVLAAQNLSPNSPQATYVVTIWRTGNPPFEIRGIVPFEFDPNVTAANQSAMTSAMAVLENVANVDFQPCANNFCPAVANNFVHIANSTGNNSNVGMIGGEQFINILNWGPQFTIVHELLHCLGFHHEQSRSDRNSFIQINCDNVTGGCAGSIYNTNFSLLGVPTYGSYDFDSVMHYGECSFTNGSNCPADGTRTIVVLPPNQNQQTLIGQTTHLSSLDRALVSFIYPFANWSLLDCTYDGTNGTPIGSFNRPYMTIADALANTPPGGTIWVLKNCTFPNGVYTNQVTVRAAPNVVATFGN